MPPDMAITWESSWRLRYTTSPPWPNEPTHTHWLLSTRRLRLGRLTAGVPDKVKARWSGEGKGWESEKERHSLKNARGLQGHTPQPQRKISMTFSFSLNGLKKLKAGFFSFFEFCSCRSRLWESQWPDMVAQRLKKEKKRVKINWNLRVDCVVPKALKWKKTLLCRTKDLCGVALLFFQPYEFLFLCLGLSFVQHRSKKFFSDTAIQGLQRWKTAKRQ